MENDGSSEVEPLKVVKWAWRHHSLDADLYDSIEDAVLAAKSASDYGDEALYCIEVEEKKLAAFMGIFHPDHPA